MIKSLCFCKLLECSRTLCECIQGLSYVVGVVVFVVGSNRLFRKLYRERELQWKIANFKKRWRKL